MIGNKFWRVEQALGHLKHIREGFTKETDYQGMTPRIARDYKTEINRTEREYGDKAAKKVAKHLSKAVKKNEIRVNGSGASSKPRMKSEAEKALRGSGDPLKKMLNDINATSSALIAAANKLSALNKRIDAAGVTTFSGSPARELNRSFDRVEQEIKAFREYFKSTLKLVK